MTPKSISLHTCHTHTYTHTYKHTSIFSRACVFQICMRVRVYKRCAHAHAYTHLKWEYVRLKDWCLNACKWGQQTSYETHTQTRTTNQQTDRPTDVHHIPLSFIRFECHHHVSNVYFSASHSNVYILTRSTNDNLYYNKVLLFVYLTAIKQVYIVYALVAIVLKYTQFCAIFAFISKRQFYRHWRTNWDGLAERLTLLDTFHCAHFTSHIFIVDFLPLFLCVQFRSLHQIKL